MFLGINMFLALLRAHFNPRYARAKMILSRAKNLFMPANVNSIVIFFYVCMFVCMYICQTLRDRSNWRKLLRLPCQFKCQRCLNLAKLINYIKFHLAVTSEMLIINFIWYLRLLRINNSPNDKATVWTIGRS